MKRNRVYKVLIVFFVLTLWITGQQVKANNTAECKNGEIVFTTTDTKATSGIRWKTIGFNIRREATGGNPLVKLDTTSKQKEYATIWLKDGDKKETVNNGILTVTFTIREDVVNKAFENTNLETIQDNDIIFLNGIFKVTHNGQEQNETWQTLSGIRTAESWKNPNDFNDRFDVKVTYEASPMLYPVIIEFQEYSSGVRTVIDTLELPNQRSNTLVHTNGIMIPKKKGDLYLYRVYYRNLNEPKTILGNRKTEVNPNYYKETYEAQLDYLRKRDFIVKKGGLKIVASYKKFPVKNEHSRTDELERNYEEIDPLGVIAADTRGNEEYDVREGIPGTEELYTNVITSNYLSSYNFIRKYGQKSYPINVSKSYTLSWTEINPITKEIEEKTNTIDRIKTYLVEREYSYWMVNSLAVYAIDHAQVKNGALPYGSITLKPNGYQIPTVLYNRSSLEKDHLLEPTIKDVILQPQTIIGTSEEPSIADESWELEAENAVDEIKCNNDYLVFNGETIMSNEKSVKTTIAPKELPDGINEIGENVLYTSNLVIPETVANGEYETTGYVTYQPVVEVNSLKPKINYQIYDMNLVMVHTPTYCDGKIQNKDNENQMIAPDQSRASLILDRKFNISISTEGGHRYIQGYYYRDYGKYIWTKEVNFPFDVYKGSTYINKNTWIPVNNTEQFYLPTWIKEGKYSIRFRSISINAYANGKLNETEESANLDYNNYVATDKIDVEISGRIYGFHLFDISDYPTWEKVFRQENSLKRSGYIYTVGTMDQNGNRNKNNSNDTFPLVNGCHPKYKTVGTIKTGYASRFSLTTVGTMYSENDYINMKPTFYYVDNKAKNRQQVDIYYSETFRNKKQNLVKMGSELDKLNKKSLRLGDVYLGIDENELHTTANIKETTIKVLKSMKTNLFTYTNIMIPESLRTFVGTTVDLPSGITKNVSTQSVQKWYGEYYLPSEIHVVKKDFDVFDYSRRNGVLNYKESFWLNQGYIIVNFEIESIQNGKRHLSYINSINSGYGYCNMWKKEGFAYTKSDNKGNVFSFRDGDYLLYYTDQSAAIDYRSSGTH